MILPVRWITARPVYPWSHLRHRYSERLCRDSVEIQSRFGRDSVEIRSIFGEILTRFGRDSVDIRRDSVEIRSRFCRDSVEIRSGLRRTPSLSSAPPGCFAASGPPAARPIPGRICCPRGTAPGRAAPSPARWGPGRPRRRICTRSSPSRLAIRGSGFGARVSISGFRRRAWGSPTHGIVRGSTG